MKRTRLKSVSNKMALRIVETRRFRNDLVDKVGRCECCLYEPRKRDRHVHLACHEILNGPLRAKTLDEPAALIVACWRCNSGPLNCHGEYPLARQLAIIKQIAPDRYDRERVLFIRNPKAIEYVTEEEVDAWIRKDYGHGTT